MTQQDMVCEATLLFSRAPDYDMPSLLEDLDVVLTEAGEPPRSADAVDDAHTLITTASLKILLARSEDPLPLDGLLAADRPSIAALTESEILKALLQVSATITILVVPNHDADPTPVTCPHAMQAICRDILVCLHGTAPSDLLFLGDSDTLYSATEFEQACTYAAHQGPREVLADATHLDSRVTTASRAGLPEHFQRDPEVTPTMSDWLENADPPEPTPDEDEEAVPAERNRWFRRLWSRSDVEAEPTLTARPSGQAQALIH